MDGRQRLCWIRRAGGAHLVEERSVRAVIDRARRPPVLAPDLEEAERHGVFVARLGPRREAPEDDWRSWRGADLTAPPEEQRLGAAGWWSINPLARAGFRGLAGLGVLQPFVAVVAGIAVVGAEVVGLVQDPESSRAAGPPWVTWPLDRIAE